MCVLFFLSPSIVDSRIKDSLPLSTVATLSPRQNVNFPLKLMDWLALPWNESRGTGVFQYFNSSIDRRKNADNFADNFSHCWILHPTRKTIGHCCIGSQEKECEKVRLFIHIFLLILVAQKSLLWYYPPKTSSLADSNIIKIFNDKQDRPWIWNILLGNVFIFRILCLIKP